MPLHSLGHGPEGAFDPRTQGNRPPDYVPPEQLSAEDPRLHPLAPQANIENERAEEDESMSMDERLKLFHDALVESEERHRRDMAEYEASLETRRAQEGIERTLRGGGEVTDADLIQAGFDKQHATDLVKSLERWARTQEGRWYDSHGERGRK